MNAVLKRWLKIIARTLASIVLLPEFLSFALRSFLWGRDRALEGSSQTLALVPGVIGQYMRRAFLTWVLDYCHPSVTVEFGTLFSKAAARLEENVYIGPHCHLGWVFIERDVLIAAGVQIPSGQMTHGTDDSETPIREQPGTLRMVRIGAGSWIGSAAVVMADVGRDTVIGAGAVVTKPIPDRVFAAGVPARVVRSREPSPANEVPLQTKA